MLDFHSYINEMNGSRSKIPSKILFRQRCAEGFNSGVKGLKKHAPVNFPSLACTQDDGVLSLRSPRTTPLNTTHPTTIFYRLLLN
jgi:hypothetical protein